MIWQNRDTRTHTHTQSKNLRENSGNWVDNSGKSQRPRDCCSCQLRQVQGCHVWQPLGLDLSCRAVPLLAALREDLGLAAVSLVRSWRTSIDTGPYV